MSNNKIRYTNANPTGNDCGNCGNPVKMYWCEDCTSNSEKNVCNICHKRIPLDKDYHKECN